MTRSAFVIAGVAILVGATLPADENDEGITLNHPDKLEWKDGPPSLPKGAKITILEVDPSKVGLFVFRVKTPDGYPIPPHIPQKNA